MKSFSQVTIGCLHVEYSLFLTGNVQYYKIIAILFWIVLLSDNLWLLNNILLNIITYLTSIDDSNKTDVRKQMLTLL